MIHLKLRNKEFLRGCGLYNDFRTHEGCSASRLWSPQMADKPLQWSISGEALDKVCWHFLFSMSKRLMCLCSFFASSNWEYFGLLRHGAAIDGWAYCCESMTGTHYFITQWVVLVFDTLGLLTLILHVYFQLKCNFVELQKLYVDITSK